MTKPDPLEGRRVPDGQRRAPPRELRDSHEPADAALQREIQRLRRESEEALAAYQRAFEAPEPRTGGGTPRRVP